MLRMATEHRMGFQIGSIAIVARLDYAHESESVMLAGYKSYLYISALMATSGPLLPQQIRKSSYQWCVIAKILVFAA